MANQIKAFDYVVVGAGIVGLTIARELAMRQAGSICILEKESSIGLHASGRNSGVLHAGIYYARDTIKAKVCSEGSRAMQEYARKKGISVKKTGKVVVASSAEEDQSLRKLFDRAKAGDMRVEMITKAELKKIEPMAHTYHEALYSPETAVIDSKAVLQSVEEDLAELGVKIYKFTEALRIQSEKNEVLTQTHTFSYKHLINAAGLHADTIAHTMGVGLDYCIMPFKGIYHEITGENAHAINGSIYPTPNINLPFLGVHITRSVDGKVFVGPTAIPALGRENYNRFDNIHCNDLINILKNLFIMYCDNIDNFRALVSSEMTKYSKSGFLKATRKLAPKIKKGDILNHSKVGIRAQLVSRKTRKLVMDFVIENGKNSTHILNAISPAFTGSFAFAKFITDGILKTRSRHGF